MVAQSAQRSHQALQTYSWIETTQVSVDGDVKVTKTQSCRYGPDGQVQKTEVSEEDAKKPFGLRGMIAERKAGEMDTTLHNAAALAHQYAPLDPVKVLAVYTAGGVSLGQVGPGTAQIKFANYVQQGDMLTLTVDQSTHDVDQLDVATWLDQASNAVSIDVNFGSLPDGTRFPATTTLLIPANNIQVQIRNTNYQKLAQ